MVAPEDFLRAAERIADDGVSAESSFRAAIHAAYYAVFHLMCHHFKLNPTAFGVRHEDIQARLDALHFTPGTPLFAAKARRCYRDIKRLRIAADYDLAANITGDDADRAIQLAKGVFAAR
jgi:uncharacterized protein (UPF0332 family)